MPVELSEIQIWLAEQSQDGFLVALWLPPEASTSLALEGGEPPEALHITLAFCGSAADMDELVQSLVVASIYDLIRYRDPLEGVISGYGRFTATEGSDEKDVFYATPDIVRLAELRQDIVNCLLDRGIPVSTSPGFTPHITLAYIDPGSPNPVDEIPKVSMKFDGVTVMSGSRRIDIPFWKPEPSVYLSESYVLPPEAPLGTNEARALYFGDFNKEWIPFLPKPGVYRHDVFGTLDFTSETYKEILQNFDNYVYKQDLPIRATHTPADGGAIGWIRPGGLRLAQDGSIEAKPEWNELGKGLVEDDRFLYTSAEYCKVWTNPVTQKKIPNVAVGLALVTRPHFKTDVLNPLSESEALAFSEARASTKILEPTTNEPILLGSSTEGRESLGSSIEESTSTKSTQFGEAEKGIMMPSTKEKDETQEATTLSAQSGAETVVNPTDSSSGAGPGANPLDPNKALVLSDLTQVVLTAEQRQRERQMFSDLQTRVELAERRAVSAETKLTEIQKERLSEKFTAEVIGRSAENGQPWFGDPKANVSHLVSLAETYGEDSAEVRWAVTQKRNEAAAIRNTGIFDPISIGGTEEGASVHAQVSRLAEQLRSSNPSLTAEQALAKAYDENPDLYVRSLKK